MNPLRELLAVFGIQVDDTQIKAADKTINGLVGTLKNAAGVIAGSFIAGGIVRMVGATTHAADRIGELSTQIGVNAQALQAWSFAAQMAGVEQESLVQTFGILARNANNAAHGGKEMQAAFARLGVRTTDANGQLRDADAIMSDVADGLSRVESDSERTALSLQVLGRSGRQLLPLFKQGAAGIAAARKELEELGGGFTDEDIAAADAYQDSIIKLNLALTKLKVLFVRELLPVFQPVVNWIIKLAKGFIASGAAGRAVKIAMAGLAVAAGFLGRALLRMLIPFAPIIAAGLGLYLVIDDLIVLFKGGKSVIGDFIDKLFGIGTAQGIIQDTKFLFGEFVKFAEDAKVVFDTVWSSIKAFGEETKVVFDALWPTIEKVMNAVKFIVENSPVGLAVRGAKAVSSFATRKFGQSLTGTDEGPTIEEALAAARAAPINNQRGRVAVPRPGGAGAVSSVTTMGNVTVNVNAPNADSNEVARKVVEKIDVKRHQELAAASAALKPLAATP